MLAYNITNDAITIVLDGHSNIIPRTAANASQLIDELRKPTPDAEKLKSLISVTRAVEGYSDGNVVIRNNEVLLNGERLPEVLGQKVIECYETGVPFANLLRFFERLKANPSQRAVTELYTFLSHRNMPITPEGHFLAYKGVNEDYWSVTGNPDTKVLRGRVDYSGRIYNGIGEVIEVARNNVDDDCNRTCSTGLHAGSLKYATGFGARTIIVSIDPADVVSIPTDCEGQKLRCTGYTVVGDYAGALPEGGVRDERNPYRSGYAAHGIVDPCPACSFCAIEDEDEDADADENEVTTEDAHDMGYAYGSQDARVGKPLDSAKALSVCNSARLDDNFDTLVGSDLVAAFNRGYGLGYLSENVKSN